MSVFLNKTGRKVDQLKSATREQDYNKSYYIILPKSYYIVKETETTSVFFLTYGLSVMTIWLKENRIFLKNKLLNNLNLWDCHKSQSSTYSNILIRVHNISLSIILSKYCHIVLAFVGNYTVVEAYLYLFILSSLDFLKISVCRKKGFKFYSF